MTNARLRVTVTVTSFGDSSRFSPGFAEVSSTGSLWLLRRLEAPIT